jgi:hypothetical protein
MNNKFSSIYTNRERLSEVASFLHVALWRQFCKEREKIPQKSLDSFMKRSVTPSATRYGG